MLKSYVVASLKAVTAAIDFDEMGVRKPLFSL
jgi:hypothetical protein